MVAARALALDHIVLVVADVERSLAWYMRHAGLTSVNVDEWRAGQAFFPSLRVTEDTILDFVPGDPGGSGDLGDAGDSGDAGGPAKARGHLDHVCFVVGEDDLAALAADPELEVVDQGERSGARGLGQSIYVRDPDGLLVEFRSYPA